MREERDVGNSVKHFKWIFGAVVIALAAGGSWFVYHQPVLYSDPNSVRDSPGVVSVWNNTFRPELSVQPVTPWIPISALDESDLHIKRTPTEVSIRIDESKTRGIGWRPIPPTLINVPQESQTIILPTGEILSLDQISVGFHLGKNKEPFYQCYDARSFEKIRDDVPKETFQNFPNLRTNFRYPKGKLTIHRLNIFNPTTHVELSDRPIKPIRSVSRDKASSQITVLKQWHSSQLSIVADVQGGSEEATISFKKGEILKTSALSAKLIWIEPVSGGYTGGGSGGGKHIFDFAEKPSLAENSTIVGLSILKRNWVPIDYKLIAKTKSSRPLDPFIRAENTQEEPASTFAISANLKNYGPFAIGIFDCRADEIEELSLVHPEKAYRLVFELASIPGLPKENYNVENLFDVKIPYAEPKAVGDFLKKTTQLGGNVWARKIAINDMTLHEVVEQIRDNQRNFKIKINDGVLSGLPSPQKRLNDAWKKMMKTP